MTASNCAQDIQNRVPRFGALPLSIQPKVEYLHAALQLILAAVSSYYIESIGMNVKIDTNVTPLV